MADRLPSKAPQSSEDLLNKAFDFRAGLSLNTDAMRLVNGVGDHLPGLIIDRYNKHFVVYGLDEGWRARKGFLSDILVKRFDAQFIVYKDRAASASPNADDMKFEVLKQGPSQTIVEENGLKFHVDLNDHLNQGLFLDMRKNRKLVASFSKDKEVLNTFAYTCSFGAHCRHAGASRVVNVDISAKFLKKGEENYKLNQLKTGRSEFLREHAVRYIERAAKRNNLFDIIILDPPSFARFEGKVFSVKKDMADLMTKAMLALKAQGILFVATNCSSISRVDLEKWAWAAAKASGSFITEVDKLGQDVDFRGSGLVKESFLSALLLKTRRKEMN
jgi:23S rRNA (cytosine1962-C5)-methyltransferase